MKNNKQYIIERIFPIADQKYFLVNIDEEVWSLIGEKDACLVYGDKVIRLRYIGFSNVNGKVTLKLVLENEEESFDDIVKKLDKYNGVVYLEI